MEKTIEIQAGNNITITGSQVISDLGTTLVAGNDLTINAANNTHDKNSFIDKNKSGIFSSGGFGFTIGKQQLTTDTDGQHQSALSSTVGSINGDVNLIAGNNYTQTGSHVLAPGGDITVAAKDITIKEARERAAQHTESKFKQSGLTLSISSPVISAIQTTTQMIKAATNTSDDRMKALAGANAALSINNAYKAVSAGQGTTIGGKDNQIQTGPTVDGKTPSRDATAADKIGGINISISLGTSKSQSNSQYNSNTGTGSTLSAGGNINLIASGAGKDSNILIQGSDVAAGKNLTLAAENDILLLAAHNAASERSSNKSSSGSIGVSVGSSGLYVNVGASKGKGHGNGDDLWWNNTHLDAGNTLTLVSGGDTALVGAVAKGQQVVADIGGDLLIESLQDQSTYDGKQQNISGSLSVGLGSQGMISGSLSIDKSKVNSDFASVGEQSGLKAGDGGFDVTVKGDTTLIGAVIASTDKAVEEDKNRFDTGSELAMLDLENKAHYKAESIGVNIGTSISFDGALKPSGSGVGIGSDSGDTSSTTQSGISGIAGNKDVRSDDKETGIKPIFDKDKVLSEIEAQKQITQLFGQQASQAVGDYATTQKNKAATLRLEADQLQATNPEQADALRTQAKAIDSDWGDNGVLRIAAHTVIGALTGNLSGAAGAALGTISAAEAARLLKDSGITPESNPVLYNSLVTLASTAAGAIVGGTGGAGAAFNEATNNFLTHPQLKEFAEKLEKCEAHNSCEQIIKEMADLNHRQQEEFNTSCSTNPAACLNQYAFLVKDDKLFMEEIERLRGSNIPWSVAAPLSILRLQQIEAIDMLQDTAFSLVLSQKYETNLETTKALVAMAAALAGNIKITTGKVSAIPVPQPTKAENGLDYKSNPKHTLGTDASRKNAGIEPSNSLSLFGSSITSAENDKARYALDSQGNVHRFFSDKNNVEWHWSGSTGSASNALDKGVIPNDVRKQFNLPGKWK